MVLVTLVLLATCSTKDPTRRLIPDAAEYGHHSLRQRLDRLIAIIEDALFSCSSAFLVIGRYR